jgi:hypothetical protein
MYRIEYRVGIAAPVDDAYDLVADIEGWPQWSPIHKKATGTLSFGAPIGLEEYYEGLGTWELAGSLADWQPYSHIHVAVPKPFYAGTLIRYFEFDALSAQGSTFAVGALFNGFLAEREGRMISGPVRRGFTAFAEALKARAEASFLAKPEEERGANHLPPKAIPDKLKPPPSPNWKGTAFFGQFGKKKK